MIKILKKTFPGLAPTLQIVLSYFFDIKKFLLSNTNSVNLSKTNLEALIFRQVHGIEKGLRMPNLRLGFGTDLIEALGRNADKYIDRYGVGPIIQMVSDVFYKYEDVNLEWPAYKTSKQYAVINNFRTKVSFSSYTGTAGTIYLKRSDMLENMISLDFSSFFKSRHSIREFTGESVDIDLIERAIGISLKTPSACNRQSWRVVIASRPEEVLQYQNGNRGFVGVDKVLLVIGLSSKYSSSERHAVWVDGGLFSMSLLLSLHSMGIGTCALNTSYTLKEELEVRKQLNLALDEELIMMIALGQLKENFKVPMSIRLNIEDVVSNLDVRLK